MKDPYANLSENDKQILREFITEHNTKQWFIQNPNVCAVNIVEKPPTMKKTLQLFVNYRPMYDMNQIMMLTNKYNLDLEIIEAKDAS